MKYLSIALVVLTLVGCATMDFARSTDATLYQALDTQPDGFSATADDNAYSFELVSTRTDGTRLCRVVNIETENHFHTESFCKVRGGEWR